MDITSNMLDVVPTSKPGSFGNYDPDDGGEELAKRVENFGHPVGKGARTCGLQFTSHPSSILLAAHR